MSAGRLDNGIEFRTTGGGDDPHPIQVIQDTGLRHQRWTVSAARFEAGVVYSSFFMGDQPALDVGGGRHDDGLGYAVFGDASGGFETLETIYAMAKPCELLSDPIRIVSVEPSHSVPQ